VPENRDIFPKLTVHQNLMLGQKRGKTKPRWGFDDMYRMFPRLKERQHTEAGVMSGGEQQMLTLCRTLMGDPDLIMIDEPTEGLAPKIVELVAEYLRELKRRGISVLLVEQKLTIALEISDRCLVMGHGSIVFEGTPAELRANAECARSGWRSELTFASLARRLLLPTPGLHAVVSALETCSKPVVAAIHGVVMGGGLELALGCHYRVMAPGVQVALPEVNIGLIPGAGGTQRLPRVLPVEMALQMVTSGASVPSDKLAKVPGQQLIAKLIEGDLLAGAQAFALEMAAVRPLPRVRDLPAPVVSDAGLFDKARADMAKARRGLVSPQRCIDAVEIATQDDIDTGIHKEGEMFKALMVGPQAKAMQHAFFGERAASKIPDVPDNTPTREVKNVAVIGAGTMGGGITMCFFNAGIPVTLLEMKQEAIDRGVGTIRKNYEAQVAKGKLAPDKYEQRMSFADDHIEL
jgi:enoyl-CoA hydratase/carnithine racemase